MKVLVDTCVWSLSLRRKKSTATLKPDEALLVKALTEGIRDGRVMMVGPVRQEVLSGVKHAEQFDKLLHSLDAFPDSTIESFDYVSAAHLDNICRAAGVRCGGVDMLLCAVALRNGWEIMTNDAGLISCIKVIECDVIEADPKRRSQRFLATI